jgi:hypothetical protein
MNSPSLAANAPVTARPLLSVIVNGEPYNFEIPEDFVPLPILDQEDRQAVQEFQDRSAPWMNEALPLEARFELLRAYTQVLKSTQAATHRLLNRAQETLREHAALDQKAFLVEGPNIKAMVFKISDIGRATAAFQGLYKDDAQDYTSTEVAGKFIFLKEPILDGEDAHRALEEHAKRLQECSNAKFIAWADLTPMERQNWRNKAMESKKYMLLYFEHGNKSVLLRANELTGAQLRALFAVEKDHRLLLVNTGEGLDRILEDDAVIKAQADVINLTVQPQSHSG